MSRSRPVSRCCRCCESGSGSPRPRMVAHRRASAGVAPCSSTATPGSRASRPSRASRAARSRPSKGSTPMCARPSSTRCARPAGRNVGSARRASSPAPLRCTPRRRRRAPTSSAPSPRTCAVAPAGRPSPTPSRTPSLQLWRRKTLTTRGIRRQSREKGERRSGRGWRVGWGSVSGGRCRSGRAGSRTTPRRATPWSQCRSRPARARRRRPRRGTSGWLPDHCWRRATWPPRCRAGAPRSSPRRRCRCRRCPPAAPGSRRPGSSPPTSSRTRRGARPATSRRRRWRTGVRSVARSRRRWRMPPASWPTRPGAPCGSCTRAKTSCGSGPSASPSPRARWSTATVS